MGESMKNPNSIASDLKAIVSVAKTRRTKVFAYGFVFAFVACTAFLAFSPSGNNAAPRFNNLFSSASISTTIAPYRSHFSSLISQFFPNSSNPSPAPAPAASATDSVGGAVGSPKGGILGTGSRANGAATALKNQMEVGVGDGKSGVLEGKNKAGNGVPQKNLTKNGVGSQKDGTLGEKNVTNGGPLKNQTGNGATVTSKGNGSGVSGKNQTEKKRVFAVEGGKVSNLTSSLVKGNGSLTPAVGSNSGNGQKREAWIEAMMGCNIFEGNWVKDDSYPLYPEGSCPHIDEPFDCYLNGRPDHSYQKLRWKPKGCTIPRLNATDMLERLRGKRLVFVGDSLNRNMWESLVCALRSSVKDKKKVFEESGRHEFRTEGSYAFLFKDYNCTVEFFRSPFLVQEWEMPDGNGTKKETLRLDLIERSSSKYKDAHVIIFNTGHWWTHEKTAKGRDYYQEGTQVYGELNVVEAFHKALNTWAKWVDANVNPKKTQVFFRGYSASHFRGGQWNSGGACDKETEPITNENYLSSYPSKMSVLESVIKGMKTPVTYLNITRMTDYRKDAHPSVYRKQNLTEEERRAPERYQDCSHWCLPGVPDSWNELVYSQLIINQYKRA